MLRLGLACSVFLALTCFDAVWAQGKSHEDVSKKTIDLLENCHCIRSSPDSKTILFVVGKVIRIFDPVKDKEIQTIELKGKINDACFLSESELAFSQWVGAGNPLNRIGFVKLDKPKEIKQYLFDAKSYPQSLLVVPGTKKVLTTTIEIQLGTMKANEKWTMIDLLERKSVPLPVGISDDTRSVAFSKIPEKFVEGNLFGRVMFVSGENAEKAQTNTPAFSTATRLQYTGDEKAVIAQFTNKSVKIWSATGKERTPSAIAGLKVDHTALPPNGDLMAYSSGATVEVVDIKTGDTKFNLGKTTGRILSLLFFSDTKIVAASDDKKITIWTLPRPVPKN